MSTPRSWQGAGVLRVLTWNLAGLDSTRLLQRAEAACIELVLGQDVRAAAAGERGLPAPDVIAMQEVVRGMHLGVLEPHLTAAGYVLHPAEPVRAEGEYSLLAVRPPWAITDARREVFEYSPLGRHRLAITIEQPTTGAPQRIHVMTGHFDSLRSGADARRAQAEEIDAHLAQADAPAVFLGDTNLREREWTAVRDELQLVDVFALAGSPSQHAATWWPPRDRGAPRGYRFDRIWVDERHPWRVEQLRTRRRPKISDHAALEALLSL